MQNDTEYGVAEILVGYLTHAQRPEFPECFQLIGVTTEKVGKNAFVKLVWTHTPHHELGHPPSS